MLALLSVIAFALAPVPDLGVQPGDNAAASASAIARLRAEGHANDFVYWIGADGPAKSKSLPRYDALSFAKDLEWNDRNGPYDLGDLLLFQAVGDGYRVLDAAAIKEAKF